LAWTPLLVGVVLFGIAPGLIFDITDPAVVNSLDNCLQLVDGCDGFAQAAAGG
jgi:hypothetical protein